MTGALELRGISKSFDGFPAISGADFAVQAGEVHALLGENGAGKSSLMNVAAGLYAPDEGRMFVDGREVRPDGPLGARRLGIGMVHQHYKLVKAFNAVENVLLTVQDGGYRDLSRSIAGRMRDLCGTLDFEIDLKRPVGLLSIAEQQRIEILKVLLAGTKVLILDEPTAVLTDREADSLLTTVKRLAAEGTAVVLVTHKLNEVRKHADNVTVMRGGKTVATATAAEKSSQDLTVLIVGERLQETPQPSQEIGEPVLQLSHVTAARADGYRSLKNVSFTVKAKEIYGIAGVGGNGQTELAEVLMGVNDALEGRIEITGSGDVTHAPAVLRRAMGIVSIPADRQSYGLAGDLPIADNFAVAGVVQGKYGGWVNVDRGSIRRDTEEAMTAYDVQGVRSLRQRAALLSGGNAQKLVIAREFSGHPRVVLAHSPSRGLDVRATAAVHDSIRRARDAGAAVLLISEDLDEILLLSDRVGVMNRGKISAEFTVPVDRKAVGEAMISHG
ncbi:MAG: ABC transporter ATP-binding protein [Alphaproteobacteria bacterium]|nr:ABC transporter ATP-binding protein [Alphaproteobacteria bacterium]